MKHFSEAEVMGGKRQQGWGGQNDIFFVILNTCT